MSINSVVVTVDKRCLVVKVYDLMRKDESKDNSNNNNNNNNSNDNL